MQEFIVSGRIPGTNFYITFQGFIAVLAVIAGMVMLYNVYRHIHGQKHAASQTEPQKPARQKKNAVTTQSA